MTDQPASKTSLWEKLNEILGLDLRSMALYRVLMGVLLLAEIAARLPDARAFYTDEGIFPRSIAAETIPLSLHLLDGSLAWQLVLFGLQAVFAVLLLVGWNTRLAVVVSWFLLISLQGRNTLVMHNGDTFLKMSLFFAMFLPLGAVWSVDSRFRPRPPGVGPLVVNAGTIAYIGQICVVYIFAVLWKYAPEWRSEFSAVHYALHVDTLASPLAKFLRQYDGVMVVLTVATMLTEASAPLLVLFPFGTQWTRLVAVFVFIGLHAGFAACLVLGNFAPVCWVGWIILLPPLFWNLMARWCRTPARQELTLQTRLAPAAAGGMESLKQFLLLPDVKLVAASDSPTGSAGWRLLDGTDELQGGLALRRLLWRSPLWWPLAWLPASVLGSVARWLGRPTAAPDDAEGFRTRRLAPYAGPALATVVLVCFVYTVAWNVRGLTPERMDKVFPRQVNAFGYALGLDQGWGVFAPAPGKYHGWYVLDATFADGSRLDLVQGLPTDFDRRPAEVWRTYINSRWRRVYQSIVDPSWANVQPYLAEWIRREWNREHPDNPLVVLEVWYMATETTRERISAPKKTPVCRLSTRSEDRPTP